MTDADLFFTHTIVGAPRTVALGRRERLPSPHATTVEVDWREGVARLNEHWHEWLLIHRPELQMGQPRRGSGRLRLWVERHALAVFILGLVLCAAAGGLLVWQRWMP